MDNISNLVFVYLSLVMLVSCEQVKVYFTDHYVSLDTISLHLPDKLGPGCDDNCDKNFKKEKCHTVKNLNWINFNKSVETYTYEDIDDRNYWMYYNNKDHHYYLYRNYPFVLQQCYDIVKTNSDKEKCNEICQTSDNAKSTECINTCSSISCRHKQDCYEKCKSECYNNLFGNKCFQDCMYTIYYNLCYKSYSDDTVNSSNIYFNCLKLNTNYPNIKEITIETSYDIYLLLLLFLILPIVIIIYYSYKIIQQYRLRKRRDKRFKLSRIDNTKSTSL